MKLKRGNQAPGSSSKETTLRHRGADVGRDDGRKRGNFVAVCVDESDRNLEPDQAMVVSKINGLLRMLKIESVVNIGRPVA